jgi:hypothetical protein
LGASRILKQVGKKGALVHQSSFLAKADYRAAKWVRATGTIRAIGAIRNIRNIRVTCAIRAIRAIRL